MKNKRKSGFTLVELIVVVAILGILAAVAIPRFQQYVLEAQVRKEIANAKTIYTAAIAYDEANGTENDPSGQSLMFYSYEKQESTLKQYVDENVELVQHGWYVDAPGKHAVYKVPTYDKPTYYVYYFDPRVITEEIPYHRTALLDGGLPVIYGLGTWTTDEDGNDVYDPLTVDEYLEQEEKY